MTELKKYNWRQFNSFRIICEDTFFVPSFLEDIVSIKKKPNTKLLNSGKEQVFLSDFTINDKNHSFVVKAFPRQSAWKSFWAKRNGSKAFRAYCAAKQLRAHSVGTPESIVLLERWEGEILAESFLVTEYIPTLSDFRKEMNQLLSHDGNAEEIANLMEPVADACRIFHNAGIIHRDLGNQNIALRKNTAGKWEIFFMDLDRVRIFPAGTLTWKQRGRDLARLDLPSELRGFFWHMYCQIYPQPSEFRKAEKTEREAFQRHARSRKFRHPIREYRVRKAFEATPINSRPLEGRELWIWDERTAQAVLAHDKKDSRKLRPFSNILSIAKEFLSKSFSIRKEYNRIQKTSFAFPQNFDGRIGMTLEADSATWEMQLKWLRELEGSKKIPVLIRIYHHKGKAQWDFAIERSRELATSGRNVAFALIQDRAAIRVPASWEKMLELVFERTHDFADFYEIAHATNRSKWGIWDFKEYTQLLHPAVIAKQKYPNIKITGPACIDFDLHSLPALLASVPAKLKLHALSQHLYVDRRGAPENFQGKFDTVRKCAIHRAIAKIYGIESEKIIISEVNWPLLYTGTFSPCGSFYCPGKEPSKTPPSVTEEDYAKYMCRYLLLAVASGHVERVYWWKLNQRGFGLIDDSDTQNWRPMPAFFALQKLLSQLAGTRFEEKLAETSTGTLAFRFSDSNDKKFIIRWDKKSMPQIY